MKRLARIAAVVVPLLSVVAVAHTYADVKTREQSSVKFEGMLGRMFNLFGGKAAKEGVINTIAVKGNRKAMMNESSGQIVDLSEEKVYDLNVKKKEYTVTTFEQIRQRMREAQERAKKEQEKEEPAGKQEQQKPTKEYEVDWDVKETGQKKSLAGYDTHETIVTVTVREKGKALEDGGGLVMTNDLWLGPRIPEMKEFADFELRYWKAIQGPGSQAMSAEQMATVVAMFPLVAKAMDRMAKDADKLAGTPLDTVTTVESVKSKDQMTQSQQNGSSSGGGIGGLLAKKMMKKDAPAQRSTIFTTHHQVLEVSKSVAASDLAIPADYKEKK